jgi:hypothetical protein
LRGDDTRYLDSGLFGGVVRGLGASSLNWRLGIESGGFTMGEKKFVSVYKLFRLDVRSVISI